MFTVRGAWSHTSRNVLKVKNLISTNSFSLSPLYLVSHIDDNLRKYVLRKLDLMPKCLQCRNKEIIRFGLFLGQNFQMKNAGENKSYIVICGALDVIAISWYWAKISYNKKHLFTMFQQSIKFAEFWLFLPILFKKSTDVESRRHSHWFLPHLKSSYLFSSFKLLQFGFALSCFEKPGNKSK